MKESRWTEFFWITSINLRYILSKKSHEKDRKAEEESGLLELFFFFLIQHSQQSEFKRNWQILHLPSFSTLATPKPHHIKHVHVPEVLHSLVSLLAKFTPRIPPTAKTPTHPSGAAGIEPGEFPQWVPPLCPLNHSSPS